jgi:hypothetical protein
MSNSVVVKPEAKEIDEKFQNFSDDESDNQEHILLTPCVRPDRVRKIYVGNSEAVGFDTSYLWFENGGEVSVDLLDPTLFLAIFDLAKKMEEFPILAVRKKIFGLTGTTWILNEQRSAFLVVYFRGPWYFDVLAKLLGNVKKCLFDRIAIGSCIECVEQGIEFVSIELTDENAILKEEDPQCYRDHFKVRVTMDDREFDGQDSEEVVRFVLESYGRGYELGEMFRIDRDGPIFAFNNEGVWVASTELSSPKLMEKKSKVLLRIAIGLILHATK